MENITVYTTHCPKCNILKKKLDMKKISYTEIDDINIMASKGIETVPVLEIGDKLLPFKEAVDWVNAI